MRLEVLTTTDIKVMVFVGCDDVFYLATLLAAENCVTFITCMSKYRMLVE